MAIVSQMVRSVVFTAGFAGASFAAGHYCKDWFTAEVTQHQGVVFGKGSTWAYPLIYATNPEVNEVIDPLQRSKHAHQMLARWKGLKKKNARKRCDAGVGLFRDILADPEMTDGIKLVLINLANKLNNSIMDQHALESDLYPKMKTAMASVAEEARHNIVNNKTKEDYDPLWTGIIALAGLGLFFWGIHRFDKCDDSGLLLTLAVVVSSGTGLYANYQADHNVAVHELDTTLDCKETFSK